MLSEAVMFVCLLALLFVFLRRKKRLTHVRFGRTLINLGLFVLVCASLIDVLVIGDGALFDIGYSHNAALEIWHFIAYIPGLIFIALGLSRMLPAIERLNGEIKARKFSEQKQREQNERLQLAIEQAEKAESMLLDAIESMPEAVAIYDVDDRLFVCNEPYRDRFKDIADDVVKPGVQFQELVRLSVESGRLPEAIGREEEWISGRIKEHRNPVQPIEQEFYDRQIYRLSETKTKSGGIVSIRTNITDMREREKALEENRAKLEEAQAIAHIGNWMHNSVENTHEWSDEAFRILGYEPGATEPRYGNFIRRVDKEDVDRLVEVFESVDSVSEPFEVEFRVVHEDKKITYVRLRSKSLFLANMSHELRTPLNAVIGFSEVLAKEIFGPLENERYREYADNIQSSGRHLLSLIDDILEYSRLESGSIELQETEFRLLDIVRSSKTMLAAKANEKSIEITLSEQLNICLRADERKLKQVLINLINNAIKFTPDSGRIELELSMHEENFISLYVIDSGYGISEEEINNVMRPFGRARYSVSKSIEGTGLGLPLAKSIVELHEGELKITSNKEKSGTTIEIRLPKFRVVETSKNFPHLNLVARS